MSDFFKVNKGINYRPQTSAPVSPAEGDSYFDSTLGALRTYQGGAWVNFGEAEAALSSDELFNLKATENLTEWFTGNNATFLNGGVLAGTFDKNTSTPLNGEASYRYTQVGGSLNDYIASAAFDVPLKFRGNNATLVFNYSYNGNNGDISPVVYDATNTTVINSNSTLMATVGAVNLYKLEIPIPLACDSIRIGFHVKVVNSGKILEFIDVILTDDESQQERDLVNITEWVDAGPTIITATTSIPTKGTVVVDRMMWRQVGSNMEVRLEYQQSAGGTAGTGTYLFQIPSGYSIDTSKINTYQGGIASTTQRPTNSVGSWSAGGTAQVTGTVVVYDNLNVRFIGGLFPYTAGNTLSYDLSSASTNVTLNQATLTYSATFSVPILGWTATNTKTVYPTDSISSDTIKFNYAGTAYNASTLANAPVGTFITYTYAANTNTKTQTNASPPSQSTADMNLNGIRMFSRPYNAASTAGSPAAVAIQVGKNYGGCDVKIYKSTGKTTIGTTEFTYFGGNVALGYFIKNYDPTTGILFLDQGEMAGTVTTAQFNFSDLSVQTNAYFTFNATKSPTLVAVTEYEQPVYPYPIAEPIVTEWVNYGPVLVTSTGTNPSKGTTSRDAFWGRRVGENFEFRIDLHTTGAGTAGTGVYQWNLPPEIPDIDTTKTSAYTGTDATAISGSQVANVYLQILSQQAIWGYGYVHNARSISLVSATSTSPSSTYINGGNTGSGSGEYFGLNGANRRFSIRGSVPILGWTAVQDSVVSSTDSFSSSTATFNYAGTAYDVNTLANAPVGTFITWTYGAGGNTQTQTSTAPTQTTASMASDGIRIFTRAYNATSTAASPARVAIQIGKGFKGFDLTLFKDTTKTVVGNLDSARAGTASEYGLAIKEYNENTGVLILDAGHCIDSATTSKILLNSDNTTTTDGYIVINASKSNSILITPEYEIDDPYLSSEPMITGWESYSPTLTGFGTPTNVSFKWRRSGENLEVLGSWTNGTVAGVGATIALPSGLLLDSSKITRNNNTAAAGNIVGEYAFSSNSNTGYVVVAPLTSTSIVYFGGANSGAVTQTPQNGSTISSTSDNASVKFSIPISGWTATNPNVITNTEIVSSDSMTLSYAGSATYTLTTLENAPVGTFITFTVGSGTNGLTKTQTNAAAPTQTTASMNQNGIDLTVRPFGSASTSATPSTVAIQIGKNFAAVSLSVFKAALKTTGGSIDFSTFYNGASAGQRLGVQYNYNAKTGILYLDCAYNPSSVINVEGFVFSDGTIQANGFITFVASKNPALTGISAPAVVGVMTNEVDAGPMIIGATTTAPTKGTTPIDKVTWHREGQFLVATYRYSQTTAGTAGSGDYLFTLPNGLVADTNLVPTYTGAVGAAGSNSSIIGTGARWDSGPTSGVFWPMLYSPTQFRIRNDTLYSAVGFVSNTIAYLGLTTLTFTVHIKVPIVGWSADTRIYSENRILGTTYLKDVKAANTAGGTTTAGAYQTRTLNTQEGDTGFCTISSNQITLQPGTYDFDISVPAAACSFHKARLQNITDGVTAIMGGSMLTNPTGGSFTIVNHSNIKGRLTIVNATVFEVQHRTSETRATNGFGYAANFGDVETFTIAKIDKIW